ncbi:MAG: ABC transporter ATP-binding protein [bacterium]|nr:ABC transporter ATP-binding protein [bacterium]
MEYRTNTGNPVRAIDGLTFAVVRNSITGILGVNGAGKTSTIRVLTGLRSPTSGNVSIEGHDVVSNPKRVKAMTGVSFGGAHGLYGRLSAAENCELFALLNGSSQRNAKMSVERVLKAVDLTEESDRPFEQLSTGMKQRVHIARALVNDPTIVYLDEPTAGLDPISSTTVRSLIPKMREEGRTVVLTTHLLFEADNLCDHIIILDKGKIVDQGSPFTLKERYSQGIVLEFHTLACNVNSIMSLSEKLYSQFSGNVTSVDMELLDSNVRLVIKLKSTITDDREADYCANAIEEYLSDYSNKWWRIIRPMTLEEAFVAAINISRKVKK